MTPAVSVRRFMFNRDTTRPLRIVIIGAGFSGIGLGIRLRQSGFDAFTIIDKGQRPGGTWRDNSYPGCVCDSPAFQYCYSFEQKRDWAKKWASHIEIRQYLEHCVQKYDLGPHIRFGVEVERATFDKQLGQWRVQSTSGEQFTAEVLISSVGQLNRPHTPVFPGQADFTGESFHSSQWNHEADLAGRRVAVIGTGASAVQLAPEIAPVVAQLTMFQRTANWIESRGDRAFTERERARFDRSRLWSRLYRWRLWWQNEFRHPWLHRSRFVRELFGRRAEAAMRASIENPALQQRLVPAYAFGAKRVLLSDNFYATLNRPNVTVETSPIERIAADGIVTRDGRTTPVDTIVYATGFEPSAFLRPIRVEGLDGRLLDEEWRNGAEAYLGIAVSRFPNLFIMYGPNTNLSHNSVLFMIECQARYILRCVRAIQSRGLLYLDVHEPVQTAFNRSLTKSLARSVWARASSWYKTESGRITANWPGGALEYWWRTRAVDLSAYEQVFLRAPTGAVPATTYRGALANADRASKPAT
jgi:cation diffusion facilitator CzcD-associated flavoprotein CzcO